MEELGFIAMVILAIFIPRTILVIIAWSLLDYGFFKGIGLGIITLLAIYIDLFAGD